MSLSVEQLENLGIEPGLWDEPKAEPATWDKPKAEPVTWDEPNPEPATWDKPKAEPVTWDEPNPEPATWDEPTPEPARCALKRKAIDDIIAPPIKVLTKVAPPDIWNEVFKTKGDALAEKLFHITNQNKKAQVSVAEFNSKSVLVMSWLGLVRLFEIKKSEIVETKRINEQNTDNPVKLITCLHCSESKIYIAYLWGCDEKGAEPDRPYVEVRDSDGIIRGRTKIFDKDTYINAIQSDANFIYIMTRNLSGSSSPFYLYRKDAYNSIKYTIDISTLMKRPVISSYLEKSIYKENTRFFMVSASKSSILITKSYALQLSPKHYFKFSDDYDIISMDKTDKLYIILRRSDIGHSKVELCYCSPDSTAFIHDTTLELSCHVIQIKPLGNKLYILGYHAETEMYEVGCLNLSNLKPTWTAPVLEASLNSSLIVVKNQVLVITDQRINQVSTYHSGSLETKLLDYKIYRNKFIIDNKFGPFSD